MREEMRSHTALAALADRQHGVVAHAQLLRLGFSKSAIGRAASASRLRRVHRGVYALGHVRLSRHGQCLAALLACGSRAVLSHGSAGWLWGLLPHFPFEVEVTVPKRGRSRPGIRLHHAPGLGACDRDRHEGLPTTAVPRTLLDLAATGSNWQLQTAVEKAERLGVLDLLEIDAMLERSRGSPGSARLRRALDIYRLPMFSRSRQERLLMAMVRQADLPRPAMNTFVAGHEIDAYWDAERFAIEVDGWSAHRTRRAFEEDPVRQEDLKLAGIDSIRITARRLEREPRKIAERLARLLAERRRTLGLETSRRR
jgi:predicted transcriptional regulator of viral defense system